MRFLREIRCGTPGSVAPRGRGTQAAVARTPPCAGFPAAQLALAREKAVLAPPSTRARRAWYVRVTSACSSGLQARWARAASKSLGAKKRKLRFSKVNIVATKRTAVDGDSSATRGLARPLVAC